MAKLSTLIDDFQDGVIDASKWDTSGTVTEVGGRARITPRSGFAFLGASSSNYDLTDSYIIAHIPQVTANGSTGTLQSGMVVNSDSNNFVAMVKGGSELICAKVVAGVQTFLSFTPYSGVNHIFWRIRMDSSNIYFETSATGSGYFIQHTQAIASIGFALVNVGFYFYAGWNSGSEPFAGTMAIESVNPGLPITASGASTSTGTLALSIAGPVQMTASGASTSTGSLSMLTVSDLDLTGNALSTSTGALAFSIIPAATVAFSASGASTSTGSLTLSTFEFTASAASTSSGSLVLSIPTPPATFPGGTWFFRPPVVYDAPPTLPEPTRPRYLNAHAKWKGGQARGRSVLKHGPVYSIVDTPTVDQMAAADIAYQGGHIYEVSAEEAYYLQAAGFNVFHQTDLLTTEDGDLITTESGDILTVEYSFGSS